MFWKVYVVVVQSKVVTCKLEIFRKANNSEVVHMFVVSSRRGRRRGREAEEVKAETTLDNVGFTKKRGVGEKGVEGVFRGKGVGRGGGGLQLQTLSENLK